MLRMTPFLLLLACAPQEDSTKKKGGDGVCEGGDSMTGVVSRLTFGRQEPMGVTWGFDLDGVDSTSTDPQGCYKADMVDPEGNTGIDSAFSGLVPALEATEAAAIEGLIEDSILTGELQLLFTIDGVDDPANDDCVSVEVAEGSEAPLLATDGTLLDWQTLTRDPTVARERASQLALEDGTVTATDLELHLALEVLGEPVIFDMMAGAMRIDVADDGYMSGFFGGGVAIAQIMAVSDSDEIGISELVESLVTTAADLNPGADGQCEELSITFEFEATPAYLFD
jgi:hypothetical protein